MNKHIRLIILISFFVVLLSANSYAHDPEDVPVIVRWELTEYPTYEQEIYRWKYGERGYEYLNSLLPWNKVYTDFLKPNEAACYLIEAKRKDNFNHLIVTDPECVVAGRCHE